LKTSDAKTAAVELARVVRAAPFPMVLIKDLLDFIG
jgi:hypothetical protein